MIYSINEVFHTIQGEGFYTGIPAIFIRFQGCTIHCRWCDTKYTWKKLKNKTGLLKDILFKDKENNIWCNVDCLTLVQTIKQQKWNTNHIVITGGEPSIFDLRPLTIALEKDGFYCQLETSGTYKIYCSKNTWVTVSPKLNTHNGNKILMQAINRSNEIKFIIERESDINILDTLLSNIKNNKKRIISLQPVSCSNTATNICIQYCLIRNWHLSIQVHKYLNVK
ncbi:7-carboxy-7-deazaguanine synthase QueE [Candidatus Pantoea edessiphila]|uniref:7-carboxy-7-deazaguanine synthase n=1 Tax=Candidatus Pantoea edessiphila TaxID=2044610 RepID=A0A2P5SZK4_9GAMM|nr:7-carboxy-7-deazaguanine synthase QueE [Candidatus Pantoea edessiphila]PPI87765.1 7-carboxy-7-deazaguanine synthase QueE [Candidatus Pantoea edessiphila]